MAWLQVLEVGFCLTYYFIAHLSRRFALTPSDFAMVRASGYPFLSTTIF